MRGRKPKPTAVKQLAGNPGKRPLNDREPQFRAPDAAPYAPRFLNEPGKAEWRRIVGLLLEAGVYTEVDRAALALYCQAWGRWVIAEQQIERTGGEVLETDKGNMYQNPWRYEANKAWSYVLKAATEFGMTPSARTRVRAHVGDGEPTFADQLSEWVEQALSTRDEADE